MVNFVHLKRSNQDHSFGWIYFEYDQIGCERRPVPELQEVQKLHGNRKKGERPELWDGHAAERVVEILLKYGPAPQ